MIIGTVTALMLIFGGSGGFSFEKAFGPFMKDAVKDKARYEQVVDMTKQADEHVKQFNKEIEEVWAEEMGTVLANYDATEEDFRSLRRKAEGSRTTMQQELLDVRLRMIELITVDEWNAMYQAIDEKAKKDE